MSKINHFVLAQIIVSFFSLLAVPLFTRIMPPNEIGFYAEIIAFGALSSVFVKFGTHQSLLSFLTNASDEAEQIKLFASSHAIPSITSVVLACILILLVEYFSFSRVYYLVFFYVLAESFYSIGLTFMRWNETGRGYLYVSLIVGVCVLLIPILFLSISPIAKYRFLGVILSFVIGRIFLNKYVPKIRLGKVFKKELILPYWKFGVWLSLQWIIVEVVNWGVLREMSQLFDYTVVGRFSIVRTLFYTAPSILIAAFELRYIKSYYEEKNSRVTDYKRRNHQYYITILIVVGIFIAYFLDNTIINFVTGSDAYSRNDNWPIIVLIAVIFRLFIFEPIYALYHEEKTFIVFMSYLVSYVISIIIYFLSDNIVLSLFLMPLLLLNIILRIFIYVKI